MADHIKPKVLVSKCIGFGSCRFNGGTISSKVVESLRDHVEFQPVCPEVSIGLGVPRSPLRLVKENEGNRIIQKDTKIDYTERMTQFAAEFLADLQGIDGAILKNRSPSCGSHDVRVYSDLAASRVREKSAGIFGSAVQGHFPDRPVENEGRLRNFRIREIFYSSLFALARFRKNVEEVGAINALTDFQAKHKLLLMSFDQRKTQQLGRIAANTKNREVDDIIANYRDLLVETLSESPSLGSQVNTLQHVYGYVSDQLSEKEKSLFEDYLLNYKKGKVPLGTIISLLRSWIARFEIDYLEEQKYFEPYPRDLMEISDSGKGRNL